ncbi:MAG: peptide chain release factor 2 [Patescibacteria group bacterium]|nr:peptide chain release factor 2 [Patescibacteria group bacterium]MDD5490254.1 peptide chain release factor 2 [Patescibacteria group bacterium]
MSDVLNKFFELQKRVKETRRLLDHVQKLQKLKELEREMAEPEFWSNQKKAKKISQQFTELEEELEIWGKLSGEINDLIEILKSSPADKEISKESGKRLADLERRFSGLEFALLFRGKHDRANAILSINAGAGGVDAQDWAEMLLRMYSRFAERKGWQVKILEESRGNEAGIKSVTIQMAGTYAYGWLKSEAGVHRLVRISPFDAAKMRHTSFSSVEVLPELETAEIKIDPNDLRIDTFMSSGHGGQGVNTTYSAVRIVHIPTGLSAACQNERSQAQNKEMALKIIAAKLQTFLENEQKKEREKIRGEVKPAEWGSQIRSYVLHPYKMIKDHRTGFETSEVREVLDGELEKIIEAYLRAGIRQYFY